MTHLDEQQAGAPIRARSRSATEASLKSAISSIVQAKDRLSITAVAAAAGVTPGLIHNKYPDIAESIRKRIGKGTRAQRDAKHEALMKAEDENKVLRADKDKLLKEVRVLASLNEALRRQLEEVSAVARSKNVTPLPNSTATSKTRSLPERREDA